MRWSRVVVTGVVVASMVVGVRSGRADGRTFVYQEAQVAMDVPSTWTGQVDSDDGSIGFSDASNTFVVGIRAMDAGDLSLALVGVLGILKLMFHDMHCQDPEYTWQHSMQSIRFSCVVQKGDEEAQVEVRVLDSPRKYLLEMAVYTDRTGYRQITAIRSFSNSIRPMRD